MKIAFSIPVHTDDGLITTIISNIKKFVKYPVIVFHQNQDISMRLEPDSKSVFVNSTSLYTGFMDGSLTYAHLSNFKYLLDNEIDFDYFIPYASNQMMLKSGLELCLDKHDCVSLSPSNTNDHQVAHARFDSFIFTELDLSKSNIFKYCPEGTFYSKSLFVKVYGDFNKSRIYSFNLKFVYATHAGLKFRVFIKYIEKMARKVFKSK